MLALVSGIVAGLVCLALQDWLAGLLRQARHRLHTIVKSLQSLAALPDDHTRELAVRQAGISLCLTGLQGLGLTLAAGLLVGWPLLLTVFTATDWLLQTLALALTWGLGHMLRQRGPA